MTPRAPVVFLAGGFGTRLRLVDSERPKPMVLVNQKPFLHWLTRRYFELGFRRFIFSTGYKAEFIEGYPWHTCFPGAEFEFVRETTPLGTGGAVMEIFHQCALDSAWIVNGDTYLPQEIPSESPLQKKYDAAYLLLKPSEVFDAEPNVTVKGHKVVSTAGKGEYFDAGAVLVTENALRGDIKAPPCSLHEVLSPAMERGRVGFEILEGTCYDIGTPGRLERFGQFLLNQE